MKSISFLFKSISGLIITILFIGSLIVNVAMFTWSAGALALSATFKTVTGITSVVGNLANTNDALKNKLLANKKRVAKLSKRIAKRTTRTAARNIASIPAEALPYVGVAVIVGVAGLEIRDACATMKDVQEILDTSADIDVDTSADIDVDTSADIDARTVCGMEVPDRDTVIASIQNSPKAAYEAVTSLDFTMPSWSDVSTGTKGVWDSSIKGAASAWNWLRGN